MQYRSWLFVAGDDENLAGAVSTGADVIVVDLADGVGPDSKAHARHLAGDWLDIHRRQVTDRRLGRWVRINPLDSRLWRDDLVAVMRARPDGIVLPRSAGPLAVQQLAAEIYELEQVNQIPTGTTRILPVVSETAQAAVSIAAYIDAPLPRLAGLTWDAEGLASALGATRTRGADGTWTDVFRFVRSQILLTAHARGILAIDSGAELGDGSDSRKAAVHARADGFSGMLATDPADVTAINEAFTPSEAELADARAVIAAANASAAAGLYTDPSPGQEPQLKLARRMLGLSDGAAADGALRAPVLRSA